MREEYKRLTKYFAVLFAVLLLVFNWRYISWFFNYDVIGQGAEIVADKLNPENALPILRYNPLEDGWDISASSSPNNQNPENIAATGAEADFDYLKQQHFLEIPKLAVKAPIMFTTSTSQGQFAALLKKGVLHHPSSVLPGQKGAVVILGHSSSPYWPKINYDWVFSSLNQLQTGDVISLDFSGQKYQYKVVKQYILNRGAELKPDLTNSSNVLVLISCWPPGRNKQRIVIEAELVK